MSWLAEAKAMASASAATTHGVSGWLPTPASPRVRTQSATCVRAAQPRRRPKKGGVKRSISGDQRNLKVQGACARVIRPTTRMSTPILRIQSGMAIHTRPSGRPDENDSSTTDAVRHERIAAARLAMVPGGRAGGESPGAPVPRWPDCASWPGSTGGDGGGAGFGKERSSRRAEAGGAYREAGAGGASNARAGLEQGSSGVVGQGRRADWARQPERAGAGRG